MNRGPVQVSPILICERARQETAYQLGLLVNVHQECVVAVTGGKFAVRDIAITAPESADDFERLVARIEPVGCETDHQEPRLYVLEGRCERMTAAREIEIVHRLGDVQVRIRVEAVDELSAAITEVAFHFELV